MLKRMKANEGIQYERLTPEQMKAHGILGRLVGVCADFVNPTRNGRGYSEKLWENVFSNPIMCEKIKNGVCFGELNHPKDRTETDPEKIAVCLRQEPVKNDKGQLCACFDILDTPCGRILKTLCDYGSIPGVSSRGQGDLITDENGNEMVDPDTYECECFDIVLVPAVEAARLRYIKEGLDSNKGNLKKALCESLENASEKERKVMEKTLEELQININETTKVNEDINDIPLDEIDNQVEEDLDEAKEDESTDDELEDVSDDSFMSVPTDDLNEPEDNEADNIEGAEDETSAEVTPEEVVNEIPTDEIVPTDNNVVDDADLELITDDDNSDIDIEAEDNIEEDTRTDEEIFKDYLANNFDDDQIKKVCKALDIELDEIEELKIDDSTEDANEASDDVEDKEADAEDDKSDAEDDKSDDSDEEKADDDSNDKKDDEDKADDKADDVDESSNEECNGENCADTKDETSKDKEEMGEANDNGSNELLKSLEEQLKEKANLENEVKELQEKLAVSDTKVNDLSEECNRYKEAVTRLSIISKEAKTLKESSEKLEESLKEKDAELENQKTRIARLIESRKESVRESTSLNESVTAKSTEIATLSENLNKANEEIKALNEKLKEKETDSSDTVTKLNEELTKATKIKESYKSLANKAVNKYIDVKAKMLGITSTDIKRKLGESYSLDDVDKVCSDLQAYQINISRLPFDVTKKVGIKVNESVRHSPIESRAKEFEDDDVEDDLIRLANI